MTATSTPTPALMPKFKPAVVADLTVETTTPEPTVLKAKELLAGMTVRAWLHDAPRGTERTVESVERLEDGAVVRVAFSDTNLTEAEKVRDYKAAYRFSLVSGPAEHLTYQPFAEALA